MQTTKTQLSAAYYQLGAIFESLEKAHFELNKDFGVNTLACSSWYLSPPAVIFLEQRLDPYWLLLKYNQLFSWELEIWQGFKNKGVSLKLIFQPTPDI